MGTVSNVQRSSCRPELLHHVTFVLDYSVSNPQMFRQHGHTFRAKTIDNEWTKFSVLLPLSVRDGATGRVAKPRFYKGKDGRYLGDLPYEVEVQPIEGTGSVVGVDLGKVKPFPPPFFTPPARLPPNILHRGELSVLVELWMTYTARRKPSMPNVIAAYHTHRSSQSPRMHAAERPWSTCRQRSHGSRWNAPDSLPRALSISLSLINAQKSM